MEIVILTPLFIVLLLLVVGLGRYAHAEQLTEQAAGAAARAASLTNGGGAATDAADRAARDTLAGLAAAALVILAVINGKAKAAAEGITLH